MTTLVLELLNYKNICDNIAIDLDCKLDIFWAVTFPISMWICYFILSWQLVLAFPNCWIIKWQLTLKWNCWIMRNISIKELKDCKLVDLWWAFQSIWIYISVQLESVKSSAGIIWNYCWIWSENIEIKWSC